MEISGLSEIDDFIYYNYLYSRNKINEHILFLAKVTRVLQFGDDYINGWIEDDREGIEPRTIEEYVECREENGDYLTIIDYFPRIKSRYTNLIN